MKILYLFTFDYSLKMWSESGILEREVKYFNELKKNNIEITIITYGDEIDDEFIDKNELKVIPIYKHFKKPKSKLFRIIKSIYFPIYIYKNTEFDIIKQNQLQGAWVAIILKLISNKKLIIRTGYDVFLFSIKEKKLIYKKFLIYIITQTSLLLSNLYTVTSNDDKQFLEKYFFVKKNKIELRRNWVNYSQLSNKLSKRNFDTFLTVGRLEKQKNYLKLIELFENSIKKIVVYGEGNEKELITNFAKIKNVQIKIFNPINNSELTNLMQKYAFYITTTLYEGNPKTILEAMGAGCIVIAPNSKNNSEIITNGKNGFLFNLDFENPLETINFSDINYLETISSNAIKTINKSFSLEKYIKDEINEFSKILK